MHSHANARSHGGGSNPDELAGSSCNTNFLLKSVDFEHFLVKDDWNLNPGMGKGGSCNILTICCVEI